MSLDFILSIHSHDDAWHTFNWILIFVFWAHWQFGIRYVIISDKYSLCLIPLFLWWFVVKINSRLFAFISFSVLFRLICCQCIVAVPLIWCIFFIVSLLFIDFDMVSSDEYRTRYSMEQLIKQSNQQQIRAMKRQSKIHKWIHRSILKYSSCRARQYCDMYCCFFAVFREFCSIFVAVEKWMKHLIEWCTVLCDRTTWVLKLFFVYNYKEKGKCVLLFSTDCCQLP